MPRLAPQPWMTSARRVMEALEKARPGSARFVGGCVRNALLGEPVADVDIATQLTPDKVEAAMLVANVAVHPTGIDHGTLTVVADHHPFEVTTLRRDVETDGRRATVAFTEDWTEDAQRRDFRMNALYASSDGEIFDPANGGLDDIANRRIVFVGDPETRIREDYLRILRFFRFCAWYGLGDPDAAGLAACAKLKGGLAGISAERIWAETKKLFAAPNPVPATLAMKQAGVLDTLFPDVGNIDRLGGVMEAEAAIGAKPDSLLRFASVFAKDADLLAAVSRRLKVSNEERDRLVWPARATLLPSMSPEDVRRTLYRIGPTVFRDRILLDWRAAGDRWKPLLAQAENYVRPVLPVTGEDLLNLGVAESPAIGAALRQLEVAWIASDFALGRNDLLGRLKK
jgi:poly(A) polymerase